MKRFFFIILSFAALSCAHDPESPIINDNALRATSWAQIPLFIEQAIEGKSIVLYDSLLADDFIFHFNPRDVARNPDLQPSWKKEREIQSVSGLFDDALIGKISVDWVVGSLIDSPIAGCNGRVVLSDLDMRVPRGREDGVVDTFRVGGEFVLDLKEMPWLDEYGNSVWKVVAWWERSQPMKPGPQCIK
ncbi:MAG: hypothetical protein KJ970_09715 [Candidatus Eisenbacteria bacterium]|uniref:Lipoprotein n=1 Tax=Eiseniibacteriota bacterium TaxID=2212470 RepID=A0A948W666_UNCEI|nr:hypothetical protein [Candidatus Eisenbacteria bacterium]MBU1949395.1 hypothetical protein [Candidatus Eisenbacteria bacterium]MBU2691194.1 hypothetical protein [Candidatus Eisenbacteria bacterium]